MSDQDQKKLLDQVLSKSVDELHPWESCVLPSQGVYYNNKIPGGAIEVKPLGLYAEKVLTTNRLVRTGEALDFIYQKHVRLPNGFDPLDLLESDREFILYYLRGITHGNLYEFVMNCPACSAPSEQSYDLNNLWTTVRKPDTSLGSEPFKLSLPYFSKVVDADFWVKIRFLRGRDAMEMLDVVSPVKQARSKLSRDEAVDQIKERGSTLNDTLEQNINKLIVDAMGETNRSKIKELVDRMHSADIGTILTFLAGKTPGIDTSIEADCSNPKCKVVIRVPLPITDEFFRPKNGRATGT